MAITINNVSINNQLTIINDAGVNPSNSNNGPKNLPGNTEVDVIIDGNAYLNISGNDIVPSNVHALQFNASTNEGWIEFDGNDQNQSIDSSTLPAWANTMITRWNGEKVYAETYAETYTSVFTSLVSNLDVNSATYSSDYEAAISNATTQAATQATLAKDTILGV